MVATYQQIAAKYAGAVRERKSAIAHAKAKVKMAEAKLEAYKIERENYRQPAGRFDPECARMWGKLSVVVNKCEGELRTAKLKLADIELGEIELDV